MAKAGCSLSSHVLVSGAELVLHMVVLKELNYFMSVAGELVIGHKLFCTRLHAITCQAFCHLHHRANLDLHHINCTSG